LLSCGEQQLLQRPPFDFNSAKAPFSASLRAPSPAHAEALGKVRALHHPNQPPALALGEDALEQALLRSRIERPTAWSTTSSSGRLMSARTSATFAGRRSRAARRRRPPGSRGRFSPPGAQAKLVHHSRTSAVMRVVASPGR